MGRSRLSATMLAELATKVPPHLVSWSQQPLQQQMDKDDSGDDDSNDGGDDDSGDDDSDQDGDDDSGDDDSDDDESDKGKKDEDRKLGPAGQKALDRIKANNKKLRADLKAEREKNASKDDKPNELVERTNRRIVASEVKVAAAGKLKDPRDAARFLDLSDFDVDGNGDVDEDAIAEAIDGLLEDKPYLAVAAQGGTNGKNNPKPDRRQGGSGGRKVSGADLGRAEAEKRFGAKKK